MGSPDKHTSTASAKSMGTCNAANQLFRDLERLRKDQDQIIRKINRMHNKLSTIRPEKADTYNHSLWRNLRGLYVEAKNMAEVEEEVLANTVVQLDALIPGGQQQPQQHRKKPASSTTDPKRKRMNFNSGESPRISSSPAPSRSNPSAHLSIAVGDQVAARVSPEEAESHEWIVVKVTGIDREGNKFEVFDEEPDDDGEGGVRAYKLPMSCIIPFPKKFDANTPAPDFPQGSHVLAVYPGTTALYKASVIGVEPSAAGPHRKKMKLDDLLILEFDGDEEEGVEGLPRRPVPFHHVVTLPEGHRQ